MHAVGTAGSARDDGDRVSTLDLRGAAREAMPVLGVSEALRGAALATWHARMINEYASHEVFLELAEQLAACGFGEEARLACVGFADEERLHGVLCGAVVEALGGEATATLLQRDLFPQHMDAPTRARALRNIISVCCMSETVAVSLIGAERLEMPRSPLRDLLTTIYADEVGHARFGWRLLGEVAADLSAEERDAIDRYLPVALSHLVAHELAHLPARHAPSGGETLGLCSGLDARVLLFDTISQVIVPQLDALGFKASLARAA